MRFEYCPKCGTKLVPKIAGDDGLVPYCERCCKYWFDTFASVSICMVTNEFGEIAMLKQSYLSDKYWTYVAGYIKPGENAEETAIREVKEEIGINLDRIEFEGTHWFPDGEQLMHAYIGYARKQELVLSKEVDEAKWVAYEDAPKLMFPRKPGNTQQPLYEKFIHDLNKKSTL